MSGVDLQGVATQAAQANGLDPQFFLSLIGNGENGFANPGGVSPKGAMGPGQLMPATAREMGVQDITDPVQNIYGAAKYAKQMHDRFGGDPELTAAAYNAGPGAVQKYGGVPPYKETQAYVARVTGGQTASASDDLPNADDVMKAYGWGGQGTAPANPAAITPAPDGTAVEVNINKSTNPDFLAAQAAHQAASGADDMPSPDAIAHAYGWQTPAAAPAVPTAPKGSDGSLWGDVTGAVEGAWGKLKSDAANDYQATTAQAAQPLPGPVQAARNALSGMSRTAGLAGDAVNLLTSPVAGATHALVVRPVANAMDHIGLPAYAPPTLSMAGGRPALTPAQRLTPDQEHAANEASVNTALMGVGPEAAPAAVSAAPAISAPNALRSMADRFTAAGVSPVPAAAGGAGASAWANTVAENPVAGFMVRKRLQNALSQTQAAAGDIASGYGDARGPQITGENIQSGVENFAKNRNDPTSFAAKAGAAYDDVFGKLDAAMAGKTAPPVRYDIHGMQTPTGSVRFGGSQISTPSTTATLSGIRSGAQSSSIADLIADPTLSKAARALDSANGAKDLSFNDLRRLRTWVRDAQSNSELRQNIGAANLQRLEGSLTQDIYANAETLGTPQLANQLRRTDQMYRAGMERIQTALQPFADAKSGEGAYSRVVQAAGSTSSADAQKLLSLKRSLSPDEWGDVAANAVNELGKPSAGAAPAGDGGFSVNTFVTNFNKLSPRGKDVLFGSVGGGGQKASELRAALDNLASVASDLKGVQKGANTSKTFVNAQTAGTMAGLMNPHTMIPTALGLGGMAITGEMLTNPAMVRWLTRIGSASRGGPQAVTVVVKQLGNATRANAALAPLYQESMKLLAPPHQMPAISAAASPQQQQGQ